MCGHEAYMPYLCNLDYVMFGILGAPCSEHVPALKMISATLT